MKKKTILVVLLGVMGLAALSIGNAEAAEAAVVPPWYMCTIKQVGANWTNNYVVILSDTTTPTPRFTNVTFIIDKGADKDMYVAALTAFASGCNVLVYLKSLNEGSKCLALYATQ